MGASLHPAAAKDILIRLTGLIGIALSAAFFASLHRIVHAAPGRDPTIGLYVLIAIGFLSASLGSGLLLLGHHINDEIELSERWRRTR